MQIEQKCQKAAMKNICLMRFNYIIILFPQWALAGLLCDLFPLLHNEINIDSHTENDCESMLTSFTARLVKQRVRQLVLLII